MAKIGLGTKLAATSLIAVKLAAGCSIKSDEHLPEELRVDNAYTLQWLGAVPSGKLCLSGSEVDTKPNTYSDYDRATMIVDTANRRFTVTSALGDVTLNMAYTITADERGHTSIVTGPADDAARDFMLSQGCELPE